jgi:hypothetical protein
MSEHLTPKKIRAAYDAALACLAAAVRLQQQAEHYAAIRDEARYSEKDPGEAEELRTSARRRVERIPEVASQSVRGEIFVSLRALQAAVLAGQKAIRPLGQALCRAAEGRRGKAGLIERTSAHEAAQAVAEMLLGLAWLHSDRWGFEAASPDGRGPDFSRMDLMTAADRWWIICLAVCRTDPWDSQNLALACAEETARMPTTGEARTANRAVRRKGARQKKVWDRETETRNRKIYLQVMKGKRTYERIGGDFDMTGNRARQIAIEYAEHMTVTPPPPRQSPST